MEFLDRLEERKRLERFLALDEGAVACIYGRRRIGKSRILEEVLADSKQVVFYCADRSEPSLQLVARYPKVVTRLFVAEGGEFDCVDLSWVESNIEKSGSF